MNLIRYLTELANKAKEEGNESPTGIHIMNPSTKSNRKQRRTVAAQAHNHSELARKQPKGWKKAKKAARKRGRR